MVSDSQKWLINNRAKNVQFGNRVEFGDKRLWNSYREQVLGPSNARFDFIIQSRGQQPLGRFGICIHWVD